MNDVPDTTARWQFSIRSMLALTALAATSLAGATTGNTALMLGCAFVGSLCGCITLRCWVDKRVATSGVGGAVGGGLTLGVAFFVNSLVRGIEFVDYPTTPEKGLSLAIGWGIAGWGTGTIFGVLVGTLFAFAAVGFTKCPPMADSPRNGDSRDVDDGRGS